MNYSDFSLWVQSSPVEYLRLVVIAGMVAGAIIGYKFNDVRYWISYFIEICRLQFLYGLTKGREDREKHV